MKKISRDRKKGKGLPCKHQKKKEYFQIILALDVLCVLPII